MPRDIRMLLDTDIGSDVDDALALLLALKLPNVSLEGITTVYGNVYMRAAVAQKIIDAAGRNDIPIHPGESQPIYSPHSVWHTGREGEGVLTQQERIQNILKSNQSGDAVHFLIDKIMSNPGEYTLVTIGALTNFAKALEQEPRIANALRDHYMMGGQFSWPDYELDPSNFRQTYSPEHNIVCDVAAAQKVLSTPMERTIVPLDVTTQTYLTDDERNILRKVDSASSEVASLVDVWFDYRSALFRRLYTQTCLHDPLTVALAAFPELGRTVELPIKVDRIGRTLRKDDGIKANVCYSFGNREFKNMFDRTVGIR